MLRRRLTTTGNSAALALSQDLLALLDLEAGAEVELRVVGKSLVVRGIAEGAREAKVSASIERVVTKRGSLMRRLAKGVGDPDAEG
jgi:antitoxin component of MazEF toxin-antitoxin module